MINVMIADDHAIVRQGLKQILSETDDINVTGEAETGFQAIKIARQPTPVPVAARQAVHEEQRLALGIAFFAVGQAPAVEQQLGRARVGREVGGHGGRNLYRGPSP